MLSEEEWLALARSLESDRVERKRSAADRQGICRAICAFANDLADHAQPGVIIVGMEDDASCAGLEINDRMLRELAGLKDNGNILPVPSMEVIVREVDGCQVAVIEVMPAPNPPVRYRGQVWVRVGPTNRSATPEEEARLTERRRAGDRTFDLRAVPDAELDDLDLEFFEHEYIGSALAREVIEENRRPLEQRLASLRFITRGHPNNGALLVLGRQPRDWVPGAYLQFLRIDGSALGDPVKDEKQLDGTLPQIMSRLDELLEVHIQVAVDLTAQARDVQQPDYPARALQQLIRNALIHRAYEGTNAPVRVYWFNDRIEISNPGGLYGQVNERNFGQGATDYRNPLLAEAMGVLGYVQRYGFGIPLARSLLEDNGNPAPEFRFEAGNVLVIVRAPA
ncbi:MAG: transcriptional regulator [Wenzhouxiangella sp.]|nr:MAG: transcriptional regulator [Wenzhouxiangella sp.]